MKAAEPIPITSPRERRRTAWRTALASPRTRSVDVVSVSAIWFPEEIGSMGSTRDYLVDASFEVAGGHCPTCRAFGVAVVSSQWSVIRAGCLPCPSGAPCSHENGITITDYSGG